MKIFKEFYTKKDNTQGVSFYIRKDNGYKVYIYTKQGRSKDFIDLLKIAVVEE